MKKLVLFLVISAFLLQSTVKTAMVIQWKMYQKEITELYCINKNKPEMQCNGQCHLAKQMRRIESDYEQSKRPFSGKHLKPVDFLLFYQPNSRFSAAKTISSDESLKGGLYRELHLQQPVHELFRPPQQVLLPSA